MNTMASFIHNKFNAITKPSPTANKQTNTEESLHLGNTIMSGSEAVLIYHAEVKDVYMGAMAAFIQDEFSSTENKQDSATTTTTNTSIQNNKNIGDIITFGNKEQDKMDDTIILNKLPAGTPSSFNILDFADDMSVI